MRSEPTFINIVPWEMMAAQLNSTTAAPSTNSPASYTPAAATEQPASGNTAVITSPEPAAPNAAPLNLPSPALDQQPASDSTTNAALEPAMHNAAPTEPAVPNAAPADATTNTQPAANAPASPAVMEQPADSSNVPAGAMDTPVPNTAALASPSLGTLEAPETSPVPDQMPAADDRSAMGAYPATYGSYGGIPAAANLPVLGMYAPSSSGVGVYGSDLVGGYTSPIAGTASIQSIDVQPLSGDESTDGTANVGSVNIAAVAALSPKASMTPALAAKSTSPPPAASPKPAANSTPDDADEEDDDEVPDSRKPVLTKSLLTGVCYTVRVSEAPVQERSTTSGRSSMTRHTYVTVPRTVCGSAPVKPIAIGKGTGR
jgi:hypothetical protein